MTESLAPPPRNVKPRSRKYKHLPVMVIIGQDTLTELGELGTVADLIKELPKMPPTLFAKVGAADFVAGLDSHFSQWDTKTWQWRATTHERDIIRPDGIRVAARLSTVIHYFGWKGGSYHRIIDPVTMYGHRLDTIWPGEESQSYRLLQWTVALRNFCEKNGMEVRPTIGGISAQFLTDRRFYPRARRKVPRAINERARHELPGNHYVLNTVPAPDIEFTAHYLDQHRAHHYHARTTPLPDSNYLYAYGRFTDLAEICFDRPVDNFYGLYCLDLEAPSRWSKVHWVRDLERAFVFSNELQHLLDMGYKVNGVRAAWGSRKREAGISRYATWASKQLDHYGDQPWIKPLLLATYGTLATRAGTGETVFRLAKRGEEVTLVTGNNKLTGRLVTAPKKLEPRIANVIHRGMIEAATRSESIGLAQYLQGHGHRVLSIYADAVIVQDSDRELKLPFLPEPWRCKHKLNHLQFINQQAFISGEMTKLPGVSRELLKYRQAHPGHAPSFKVPTKVEVMTGRVLATQTRRI